MIDICNKGKTIDVTIIIFIFIFGQNKNLIKLSKYTNKFFANHPSNNFEFYDQILKILILTILQ